MARVSIGLPVYNGERFVEQSIRSVLAQTYDDLELIVSDNASTDGTMAIVDAVAACDDRVVVLRNDTNRGAAWNYNNVADHAGGEFFRWHAHDDWLEPTCIEQLVSALDQRPQAVLAHSWTRFVDDLGQSLRVFEDDLGAVSSRSSDRLVAVVRRLTYCNAVFGLIRADTLARTARIASFPGSDVPLLYELAVAGEFAVVPEPLFVRRPGASIKSNPTTRQLANWFEPGGGGARMPGAHLWWATMTAIARADESVAERAALGAAFNRVWPLEHARRLRRRRARRRAGR